MTSPADLAQEYTGLDISARQHLERLMAGWGLLADLSFCDLILYVPLDQFSLAVGAQPIRGSQRRDAQDGVLRGLHFVVLGQMRPTTSQTLFQHDLVGKVVSALEVPSVLEAWRTGVIQVGEQPVAAGQTSLSYESMPIRWQGEVIGVLSRAWSPTVGRRTGGLERVYLRLFERFASMVSAGIYPFLSEDEIIEEAPRVGDGVLVLDADQRVSFASPNATNALHRVGIVSAIVDSSLPDLGIETLAVEAAFANRLPTMEEIERRSDAVVLVRCIPLIDNQRVTGAVLLLRDVTDLRRRDRLLLSKDAAIREVHHRVKNNLQTISSLLRLQSRRVEDPAASVALVEAERRIQAIALVHEILAREPGEQVHFDEIVPALIGLARDASLTPLEVEVRTHGDVGDLGADAATTLAVVIAELLQNSVEHAFNPPPTESPLIELNFVNDGTTLDVEVRDNGSGFAEGFDIEQTKSLGLTIVRDLVRSQLGGSITAESGNGAYVRLAIPLRR